LASKFFATPEFRKAANRFRQQHHRLKEALHREVRPPNGKQEHEDRLTLGATLRYPVV